MSTKSRRQTDTIDLRDQPAYGLSEAARYVKLPVATLRSWTVGRPYSAATGVRQSKPLIHPPERRPLALSFWNLIEAHVLRSLRTEHGVPLPAVRAAVAYAEKSLGIERLLLRKELLTEAGDLFLEHYGELINLSKSGQLALRRFFLEHLHRVEWDEATFPLRLYPFLTAVSDVGKCPIVIDPGLAFGRPIVRSQGISTSVIAERIDAGESVGDIADDYELSPEEVEQAVLYERIA